MGVHESYCCVLHGCKYGDEDCPVEEGVTKQQYACEFCGDDGIKNLEQLARHMQLSKMSNELKIDAIGLGLAKLIEIQKYDGLKDSTIKQTDQMRKYLERIIDDLKRG